MIPGILVRDYSQVRVTVDVRYLDMVEDQIISLQYERDDLEGEIKSSVDEDSPEHERALNRMDAVEHSLQTLRTRYELAKSLLSTFED